MSTHLLTFAAGLLLATASLSFSARTQDPKLWQPGLGEYMEGIQRHHAALYFAGLTTNWELASFELKELEEGFHDANTYVPMHEGINVKELLDAIVPLATRPLHEAIIAGDKVKFTAGFKNLTVGCNACHAAAKVPFLEIIEPTGMPTVNQKYARK